MALASLVWPFAHPVAHARTSDAYASILVLLFQERSWAIGAL
jgi:hypothetical protein